MLTRCLADILLTASAVYQSRTITAQQGPSLGCYGTVFIMHA
uniref:Uncharacterized protein n=1 Tax=Anguilla anguilla TaxID=7936 RepID=A0A0E9T7V7_ANGAN